MQDTHYVSDLEELCVNALDARSRLGCQVLRFRLNITLLQVTIMSDRTGRGLGELGSCIRFGYDEKRRRRPQLAESGNGVRGTSFAIAF